MSAPTKTLPKLTRAYILGNGKVISHADLMKAAIPTSGEKAGVTQEIQDASGVTGAEAKLVQPPLPFSQLAILLERNTTHYRAVKAKAADTVLRGWTIEPVEGTEQLDSNKMILQNFFNLPSADGEPLDFTLNCFVIDHESIGNGALEIVADIGGTPSQLNHIPASTILRTRDMKLFQHKRGTAKTWFKGAGITEVFRAEDGKLDPQAAFEDQANALIYWRKYHPRSDYYGLPDSVPAHKAILGQLFKTQFNLDFFENGAIPKYLVIIEGAEMDEGLEKLIEDFFKNEMKGPGNSQRTMILPVPIEGVKVKIEKLTAEVSEGSFKLYGDSNIDEILSADGVPATRAFIMRPAGFGRDQSREVNKIYKESEIEPMQREVEALINEFIVRQGFKIDDWTFKLKPLFFEDRELMSLTAERLTKTGALTVNEVRRVISTMVPGGLPPVDGGDTVFMNVSGFPTALENVFPNPAPKRVPLWERKEWKALIDPDAEVGEQKLGEWDGAKNQRILEVVRILNPIVDEFVKDLVAVFDKAEKRVLAHFKKSAVERIVGFFKQGPDINVNAVLKDFEDFEEEIADVMIKHAKKGVESGVAFGNVRTGVRVDLGLLRPSTTAYLRDTVGPFSEKITAGVSNRIRKQLQAGISEGESLRDLSKRVETVFANVKRSKALQIARTESARAHNIGTINSYDQSGVVTGVLVSDGEGFDIECADANNKVWTTRQAIADPIEHPNCIRAFSPLTTRRT